MCCKILLLAALLYPRIMDSSEFEIVRFPGEQVIITCPEVLNTHWLLNGRSTGGLHSNPNVHKERNGYFNIINIMNLDVSLNGTTVQCEVLRDHLTYEETILIVEDHAPSVGGVSVGVDDHMMNISWVSPITRAAISYYYVEVLNSDSSALYNMTTTETHVHFALSTALVACVVCGTCNITIVVTVGGPERPGPTVGAHIPWTNAGHVVNDSISITSNETHDSVSVLVVPAVCSASLKIQNLDTGGVVPDVITTIRTTNINHSEVNFVLPALVKENQYRLTISLTNRAEVTVESLLLNQRYNDTNSTSTSSTNETMQNYSEVKTGHKVMVALAVVVVVVAAVMVVVVTGLLHCQRHRRVKVQLKHNTEDPNSTKDTVVFEEGDAGHTEFGVKNNETALQQRCHPRTAVGRSANGHSNGETQGNTMNGVIEKFSNIRAAPPNSETKQLSLSTPSLVCAQKDTATTKTHQPDESPVGTSEECPVGTFDADHLQVVVHQPVPVVNSSQTQQPVFNRSLSTESFCLISNNTMMPSELQDSPRD